MKTTITQNQIFRTFSHLQRSCYSAVFLLTFLLSASSSWGQSIFTNPITRTNPNTSNPYTTGQTVDANITVSGVGRGSGISTQNANNRYNASGWDSSSLNANDYFEWTITPGSCKEIDFTSFVYTSERSDNSIANFAFRSSVDNYASNIGSPNYSGTTISLSASTFQNITTAITFRFYAWNADTSGRTFSINDFTFNGTVNAISAAPTASAQTFCSGATVASLTATGSTLKWYTASSGGSALASTATLSTATYYVSQTVSGCESTRTSVSVTVNSIPTSVTASTSASTICASGSVNLSSSATSNSSTAAVLINENFNGTATGWTTTNSSAGGTVANAAWTLRANGYSVCPSGCTGGSQTLNSNDASQFYLSDSDRQGNNSTTATTLKSPAFSTVGLSAASLTFYQYYRDYDTSDSAIVEVSTNNTSWTTLATYNTTDGANNAFALKTISLNSYLGQATVYIRYRYTATWTYYWAIDNVSVTGTYTTPPAATFAWTASPSGFTSAVQNPTGVSPSATTTYTVTATNSYGCTATASTTVTVRPVFTSGTISSTGQTICSGGTPSVIGSTTDSSGGDNSITYSWRSSADSYAAAISGATSSTYTPPTGLTATTSYRRYAKDATCNTTATVSTGTWTVTVRPVFTSGTISSTGETICSGGTPSVIGSTTDSSGGDNSITYSWRSSADSYAAAISGATSSTYTPPTGLTATTSYRRYAKDATCNTTATVSTGTWTVTVRPVFTSGTISSTGETICSGGTPSVIGSTTNASGGDNSITYSWRSSADSYAAAISGATSSTYTPPAGLTTTTSYRRYAKDATCNTTATVSTGTWTVTVRPVFTSGTISSTGETICSGGTPTVIGSTTDSSGGDNSITYSWRSSADSYAAAISGATSSTYTPPAGLTTTTSYRRYAKDATCNTTATVSTGTWTVTVTPTLTITLGTNPTVVQGTTTANLPYSANNAAQVYVTFNSAAGNAGITVSQSAGLSGTSGNITLQLPYCLPAGTYSGTLYVGNFYPACTSTTYPFSVIISSSAAPTGSASQSFCSGATVANLTATGSTILWYAASSGGSPLATSTALVNGNHYYASQNPAGCESTARFDVTATVSATPATPGTITGTATQCAGLTSQTYSIAAVTNATSYTWTVPTGWAITAGTGTNSITVTVGASGQNGNVSVTATNSCGTSAAQSLAVTVNSTLTASVSIAASATTICSGTSVTFTATPTNGGTTPAYVWKKNGTTISGATASTYSSTALVNGDVITCVMTSNATPCLSGSPATSTGITMTVNPNVTPTFTQVSAICSGAALSALPTTSNNSITGTWSPALNNTATTTYTFTPTAGQCASTASMTITVNALPTVLATASSTVCSGTSVTLSGSGATSYSWNNGISNAVAFTPSVTTTYTVTGTAANGCTNTATSTVTVNSIPTTNGATICAGGSGSLSVTSSCADLTGQTVGANFPSTGTNSGSGTAWSNPTRVTADDNSNATVSLINAVGNSTSTSQALNATGFGFSLPTNAVITGITASIGRYTSDNTSSGNIKDAAVYLIKAGTITGTNLAVTGTNWPTSETAATYGSSASLWGTTWTASDINNSNFGLSISTTQSVSLWQMITANIDYVNLTVTYTIPGTLQWYTVSSGGTSIGTGSTFNPVGVTNSGLANTNTAGTTSYYVACSTAAGACRAKADFVINALPTATITPATATTFCTGGSVVLNANTGTGLTYLWSNGATTSSITVSTSGSYTVTVTNANGCSATSAATTVTVNALPNQATATSVNNCGTAVLTATAAGSSTVIWYSDVLGNTAVSTAGATSTLTLVNPSAANTYYAYTYANGCRSENYYAAQVIINYSTTFTGGTSGTNTDWFTAANWSCASVPTNATNVIIPTGKSVSVSYLPNQGPAYANSLTLQGTANFTVTSDHSINISDKVTVPTTAAFTLQNNASLVQTENVANEGVITVVKTTPTERPLYLNDAVMWSSPVAQKLKAISTNTPDAYFMQHAPLTNSWASISSPSTTDFTQGKGYLVRTPSTFSGSSAQPWTVSFTGVPNNGAITYNAGNMDSVERFLLVGNPYPSAISIAAFKAANPNITGVFYFFRKPNSASDISGYGTYNAQGIFTSNDGTRGALQPGSVIPSGQGFFVRMKANSGAYTNDGKIYFTNAMRVANDHGHFNRTNTNIDMYRLLVQTPTTGNNQMIVNYDPDTTVDYDLGVDAVAFTDGSTDLSSIMNTKNYRIQARGEYNPADDIPLRFKTGVAGEHRIKLQDAQGVFAADQMVCIKDNVTGTVHNLTANGDYVFTATAGTFTNRFEVVYQQAYYTALQSVSCGSTLANMSSLVYADVIEGASGYRFKVVNNTTAAVQTIDRPQHWFALNMLPSYDYNTAYSISVQVQKDGVWVGYYGTPCSVNSPNIASTGIMQINPSQCGVTLPTLGYVIATTPVAGATGYKFRITNTTAGASGANLVQEITRTNHWFTLAMLARYNYGSSYAIEVAVKTTGGYTPYGNACTVYSPAVPTLVSCGQAVATATTLVRTTAMTMATQYRFQVTRMATQETITFDTANYWFSFRVNVPGYAAGEQYGVRIAVMTAGAWSPYGDACDLTAPIASARTTEEAAPSEANLFKPVAYPNPFTSTFGISLATPSADVVNIIIYDLQGRLIEKQNVFVSQLDSLQIGTNYPSGDYLLVVAQGANIKTSHIHKD